MTTIMPKTLKEKLERTERVCREMGFIGPDEHVHPADLIEWDLQLKLWDVSNKIDTVDNMDDDTLHRAWLRLLAGHKILATNKQTKLRNNAGKSREKNPFDIATEEVAKNKKILKNIKKKLESGEPLTEEEQKLVTAATEAVEEQMDLVESETGV